MRTRDLGYFWIKEQSAEHGIGAGQFCDRDEHVPETVQFI